MATAPRLSEPFVSIEEYLHSVYETDMDYVDGVLEDRNVGEFDHGMLQQVLLLALMQFEEQANVLPIIETRTQTQATRFRVPDVALSMAEAPEQIIRHAPLLCIEVMSPEDRLSRLRSKCQDYLRMGVPAVWIFDTAHETAYLLTSDTFVEVREGKLRVEGTVVEIDVQAVFATARKRKARFLLIPLRPVSA